MSTGPVSLVVLVLCITLLIVMICKLKIHPFFTLIAVAIIGGLGFGLDPSTIMTTVTSGFGSTIGSIGIVIVLGCAIGIILEETGGAFVLANTMLKMVGKKRSGLAMSLTGYLVSIPVFSDSAFVIMSPVARALSARSGIPLVCLAGCLNAGILATHAMVPPTPGPIAAAGVFGADLGMVILVGLCAAIPYTLAASLWANSGYLRRKYPYIAKMEHISSDDDFEIKSDQQLPSKLLSFGCILLPVLLICINSFAGLFLPAESTTMKWLAFIGSPVFALSAGLIVALFLDPSRLNREQVYSWFSAGVEKSGFIVLATGAAGAFGAILRATDVGNYLGNLIASTGLPSVFVPFIITAMIMAAQGSATVSLMTGAAITAPMIGALGLHPAIATMAVAAGATFATHANCSHFWVVTKMCDDMPLDEGYRLVTIQTALGGFASILIVWLLSFVILP
ncbi:MAG: GntP family permease [Anaerotruncus sp.]|nr:GntP family permease [Anaerotruncus sp.]